MQPPTALFSSIGTCIGLIAFLSALHPLNFLRVQNVMAANPNHKLSGVTARLECIGCRIRYAPVDCCSPVFCKASYRSRRSTQADLVGMKTLSYPAEQKS